MLTTKPIVFGASGFIGKHFLNEVTFEHCIPVTRTEKNDNRWVKADLLNPTSLQSVLKKSNTVINLAYSQELSDEENICMANNLVDACRLFNISKLVHCSTAVVVGNQPVRIVNEVTQCLPETPYEKTKYAIENIFLRAANSNLNVSILRPTGVIGNQGKNIKKMLSEICYDLPAINFIRSSIYGSRPLNLVPIKDVVRALLHLTKWEVSSGIYICSADDDPDNRYDHVETIMRSLLSKRMLKTLKLPSVFLDTILRIKRSGSGRYRNRHYSSEKLFKTGFQRSVSIASAVKDFVLSELINDKQL